MIMIEVSIFMLQADVLENSCVHFYLFI